MTPPAPSETACPGSCQAGAVQSGTPSELHPAVAGRALAPRSPMDERARPRRAVRQGRELRGDPIIPMVIGHLGLQLNALPEPRGARLLLATRGGRPGPTSETAVAPSPGGVPGSRHPCR